MVVRLDASRFLDVPLEQIATIGDMPNDVLMFGVAGRQHRHGQRQPARSSAARGTSRPRTRTKASRNAVDRFILGGTRSTESRGAARPNDGKDNEDDPDKDRPRVVIIGGGFGGLHAARALKRAPVQVTLVDRNNHLVFQPLLYQVATAALDSTDIAYPLVRSCDGTRIPRS